jgi:hypothetical protein
MPKSVSIAGQDQSFVIPMLTRRIVKTPVDRFRRESSISLSVSLSSSSEPDRLHSCTQGFAHHLPLMALTQ